MLTERTGVYERLGVKRIINATGAITRFGGSLMPAEVVEAMSQAARCFVDIDELNRRAGEAVARHTGAEAGLVCGGAAAGLLLQVAACVAGKDPVKIKHLPDTTGMQNEVVIHKAHRNGYDHAWRMGGIKFVEIGWAQGTQPWELEQAIGERTAAVAYVVHPWWGHNALPLPQVVEIAHRRNVPVIVDAAAALPPAGNLTAFSRLGCDMVTYSGGKAICGPQSSGILCGRKDLVEAAVMQSSPNHAIGRPMKVGKEEIIGLVTALELYARRDHAADMRRWSGMAQTVADALAGIPGLRVSLEQDDRDRLTPQATVRFTAEWHGPGPAEVAQALRRGDPPIYIGARPEEAEVYVNSHMLQEGEPEIIARRLRQMLVP